MATEKAPHHRSPAKPLTRRPRWAPRHNLVSADHAVAANTSHGSSRDQRPLAVDSRGGRMIN